MTRWDCCVRENDKKRFQVREPDDFHDAYPRKMRSRMEQTPIPWEVNHVYKYREIILGNACRWNPDD
jgi:hypothetical protein